MIVASNKINSHVQNLQFCLFLSMYLSFGIKEGITIPPLFHKRRHPNMGANRNLSSGNILGFGVEKSDKQQKFTGVPVCPRGKTQWMLKVNILQGFQFLV